MLYSPLTLIHASQEFPLASGAVVTEAGAAYVTVMEKGRSVVKPATGAAQEKFLGFSSIQTSMAPYVPSTYVKVETLVVPTNGLLTLAKSPINGTVSIVNDVTKASVVVGTLSANTVIAGTVTSQVSDAANLVVTVTYTYTLSALEARTLVGDIQPGGGYIGNTVGQVGLAMEGTIYTNQFDSAVNWATAANVTLAAGGKVTTGGSGTVLKAIVVAAPSVGYPYLGLKFRAEF